jgi:nicotinamide-nucleotide amidase
MSSSLQDRADLIVRLAQERHKTLATVESCTAGSLAHLLAQAKGASDVLHGGFVEELVEAHTAVSAEVAQAMADGGLALCPADIVVAITGVAGPGPDEDGNPVGLVFVAVACRDGCKSTARRDYGETSKQLICAGAMAAALDLIEQVLETQVR